jgi:hypothetical protein
MQSLRILARRKLYEQLVPQLHTLQWQNPFDALMGK